MKLVSYEASFFCIKKGEEIFRLIKSSEFG